METLAARTKQIPSRGGSFGWSWSLVEPFFTTVSGKPSVRLGSCRTMDLHAPGNIIGPAVNSKRPCLCLGPSRVCISGTPVSPPPHSSPSTLPPCVPQLNLQSSEAAASAAASSCANDENGRLQVRRHLRRPVPACGQAQGSALSLGLLLDMRAAGATFRHAGNTRATHGQLLSGVLFVLPSHNRCRTAARPPFRPKPYSFQPCRLHTHTHPDPCSPPLPPAAQCSDLSNAQYNAALGNEAWFNKNRGFASITDIPPGSVTSKPPQTAPTAGRDGGPAAGIPEGGTALLRVSTGPVRVPAADDTGGEGGGLTLSWRLLLTPVRGGGALPRADMETRHFHMQRFAPVEAALAAARNPVIILHQGNQVTGGWGG
eukprot:scaffold14203_cov99-Isochrysis_galbana.AAC.2